MHVSGNIEFTTDVQRCITQGDIIFISVNTPPKKQGQGTVLQSRGQPCPVSEEEVTMGCETDLSAFMSVVREIGGLFDSDGADTFHKVLVEKSTVPLGTAVQMESQLAEMVGVELEEVNKYYSVVNMPEFLAEGSAIRDLVAPQRVVIGTKNDLVFELINNLVQCRKSSDDTQTVDPVNVIRTHDTGSSELGKLMSNAMLAQRISSMNSVTELCEMTLGCDIASVKAIVQADDRIGGKYLQCSLGFGGSCFEKDLQSLIYILYSNSMVSSALYWQGVLDLNLHQKTRLADVVIKHEAVSAKGGAHTTIAVFGFSYKKNTSDTRCTPCVSIIAKLV